MTKRPQITDVHVDSVRADGKRAAAGFTLDNYRYHIWFNPIDMKHDGVLYKNPAKKHERGDPAYRTQRLDPNAKTNRQNLDEMWRQIAEHGMISEALRIASYEAVRGEAEIENQTFDRLADFNWRARLAVAAIFNSRPEAIDPAAIAPIISVMEYARSYTLKEWGAQ